VFVITKITIISGHYHYNIFLLTGNNKKKTLYNYVTADKPYAAAEQPSGRHATDQKPANFAAAASRRSHHTQHQTTYQQHQLPNRNNNSTGVGPQNNQVESSTVTFNEGK